MVTASAVAAPPPQDRPAGIRRSSAYLVELEALRGVAIALVFLWHLSGQVNWGGPRPADMITPLTAGIFAGHTGVSLFFVLSAFLLSLPFLEEAAGGRRVDRSNYARRRALRILPLYWFAVVVATLATADRWQDLQRGFPYLVFLNAFPGWTVPIQPYSAVWWSLATEVHFYLLLPSLPFFLRRRRLGTAVLAGYAAAYGLFLAGRLHADTIPGEILLRLSVFGRSPFFLLGILAAELYRRCGARWREGLQERRWLAAGGADAILLALATALAVVLTWATRHALPTEPMPTFAWRLAEAPLWTAIVLVALLAPLRCRPLLRSRALTTLGTLSYSIYVVHLPVIFFAWMALRRIGHGAFIGWGVPAVLAGAGVAAAAIGLATLTYRFVERPFLVRKARLDR